MRVLFIITSILFLSINTDAQVVQLGTGTTTNTITEASPINIWWRRQVAQIVYTAAEINAAGGSGPNTLSQLGFYVTNQPIYPIPGYTIKLKHTTATNVNNALGTTGWTTVKNSFSYAVTPGGYDMIVFDTPFNWDGVQNIGVEICWSQVQPTWDPTGQCRIYTVNNGYRSSRDDNAGSICGNSPATRTNSKPQVQLVFKTKAIWNGSADNDWFNDANWDIGTPDQELHAHIPIGPVNMPVVTTIGAECKNLIIDVGATLTLAGSNNIDIYADSSNNGTFSANTGNVTLKGSNINNINGASNQDLYNLTIDNVHGAVISSGSINLHGSLNVGLATGNFNTNNALTIISDASGTGRIDELTFKCKYTLDMSDSWGDGWNGGFITVLVNGAPIGDFFGLNANSLSNFYVPNGSTVQIQYTNGTYDNENSYILYDGDGNNLFNDGPTPANGIVFTTTSSCSFFNPISGDITMQRYIYAGATNWRFLSSAVSGTTLADLNDDFITSGFTGSDYPFWPIGNPWPSINFYDETVPGDKDSGFVAATNITNPMAVGTGIWAYSGDTITGTQPFTIDMTGPPNVGDIVIPLTYTNHGLFWADDDGWNMVGNPYASTLDWDSPNITKSGIDNAIFIYNTNFTGFSTYKDGLGINGGSRYIASSQAFWIQGLNSGAFIQVTESSKSSVDGIFFKTSIIHFSIENKSH